MARGPLAKPSSLSNASDWLSLAAKALGKAPVHASQSTWGSPEALLRIKQQAVQVSINDALPLEHTDATPSAVGTGFVVEATLGIIATVRGKRSAFCFLFFLGGGGLFKVPFCTSFSRPFFSPTSNQNALPECARLRPDDRRLGGHVLRRCVFLFVENYSFFLFFAGSRGSDG